MNQYNLKQVNYWEHHRMDERIFDLFAIKGTDFAIVGCSNQIERAAEMSNNFIYRNSSRGITVIGESIRSFDFVLLTRDDTVRFSEELENFTRLYDGGNGVSFFQNLKLPTKPELVENKKISAKLDQSEYFGVSTLDVSNTIDLNARYVFKLNGFCKLKKRTDSFQFVMHFFDEQDNVVGRKSCYTHQLSPSWNRGERFEMYIPMVDIPERAAEIRVYLYNPIKIEVVEMEMDVFLNEILF